MQEMGREFELRRDASVRPPAARLAPGAAVPVNAPDGQEPPWRELYQDAERERRIAEREKRELADFSSGVLSVALSLAKLLVDSKHPQVGEDGATVTIPKDLHERNIGAGLTLGEDREGNPFVTIRERGSERISPAQ